MEYLNTIHHNIKFGPLKNKSEQTPKWEDLLEDVADHLLPAIDRKVSRANA
jgi:hypothetical protein